MQRKSYDRCLSNPEISNLLSSQTDLDRSSAAKSSDDHGSTSSGTSFYIDGVDSIAEPSLEPSLNGIPNAFTPTDYLSNISDKSEPNISKRRSISLWYQQNLAPSYQNKVDFFRRVFRHTNVDTDRLLVDYSCALYTNGLLNQGRLFITEQWVCFYSKIISEFKLILDVKNIVTLTKEKTAKFIPNAIQFVYRGEEGSEVRYFFTSFAARERTFAILEKIWENDKTQQSLWSSDFQSMSMEEVIRQVREIYGDNSADALIDNIQQQSTSDMISPTPSSFEAVAARRTSTLKLQTSPELGLGDHPAATSSPLQDCYDTRQSTWATGRESMGVSPPLTDNGRGKNCSPRFANANITTTTDEDDSSLAVVTSSSKKFSKNTANKLYDESMSLIEQESDTTTEESENPFPPHPSMPMAVNGTSGGNNVSNGIARHSTSSTGSGKLPGPIGPAVFEAASCNQDHEHPGRLYLDVEFPLGIDALFRCLFTECQFNRDFLELRGTADLKAEPWHTMPWLVKASGPQLIERKLTYTVALKQKVGPRSCSTVEKQNLLVDQCVPHRRYVVDTRINNENVPFCNSFHVECRYCLLSVNRHSTRLKVHSLLVFDEKVFFGVRNIIESTCRTNTAENFNDLADLLKQQSLRLQRGEQVHGGPLVKMTQEGKLPKKSMLYSNKPVLGQAMTIESGKFGASTLPSLSPGGQSMLFQVPRTDRDWLIVIAISVLLCLCLSMMWSRFLQLEEMATQWYQPNAAACHLTGNEKPNLEVSLELDKIRATMSTLQEVLVEMKSALGSLDKRLETIAETYARAVSNTPAPQQAVHTTQADPTHTV